MSQPQHAAAVVPLVDRFMSAVRRRTPKHSIDDAEFIAFIWRSLRALELRTIDNPENLPQVIAIAQRCNEMVNVAIEANAQRYKLDPRLGAAAAECARIMGVSEAAISQRRNRGRAVIEARIEAAGAVPIRAKTGNPEYSAEARRERQAIAAAAEHAVTFLADFRARKAS